MDKFVEDVSDIMADIDEDDIVQLERGIKTANFKETERRAERWMKKNSKKNK